MDRRAKEQTPCDLDALSAAVDGELTSEEMAQLQVHLDHCATCRQTYAVFQALARQCRSLPVVTAPAELVEAVRRVAVGKLGQRKERSRFRFPVFVPWQWAAAAAAALMVVGFAVFGLLPRRNDPVGLRVVATAHDSIAGLDLVFAFDAGTVSPVSVVSADGFKNFLMVSEIRDGELRVSMANATGVELNGLGPVLDLQIRPRVKECSPTGCLRLRHMRAYRPDGTRTSIEIEQVPLNTLPSGPTA